VVNNFPSMAGAIFALESDNNYIYAQTSMYFLKSSNNGQNWVTENNPGGINLFYSNGRLYSGGSGLKVSTNSGANWTLLLSNGITSIFVDDSIVFAGSQNDGLLRSSNYGQNFVTVIPGNIRVNSIYKYNNYVFAQADTYNLPYYIQKNFYVSTDKGFTFIKRTQGLDSVSISSMVYYNNYIYIAVANYGTTNVAIYKRLLQDLIGIKKEEGVIPESYALYQNYPNPFNQSTVIKFQIKSNELVELKVFDINGKELSTLVNENLLAGLYQITFDAGNLPSGVYLYKLSVGKYSEVKKMIFVK
ncbi:MAG: T9SS type A sorting domain-containing protein, partial [Ignavibacteria bacterium]|nr:T9SS type A sorting domain-containing protein [Ignavibacteria bacterium]